MSDTGIIFLIIIIPALYSAYLWYEIYMLGTEFRAHKLFHTIRITRLENKIKELKEELKTWRN